MFRQQKLIQNCRPPSFFLTNTMALHQVLWLGQMAPDSNISLRWLQTSYTKGRGIHLNCSLKGVSSVTLIVHSVEWVQPNSAGSNEKTSWYLAKILWAASVSSGGHEFNPLRSNSSNSFPCFCLVVKLGGWKSWGPSLPLHSGLWWSFWHCGCSHCSGHWSFLSEHLGVGHTVPYCHDYILATFS